MENTPLESAIIESAEQAINTVRDKEDAQIKVMEEKHTAEIEAFRRQTEIATQARIEQELSRIENRTLLERKKLKLHRLEDFIRQSVDEVMRGIRSAPRYCQFLLDTVCEGVGHIPAGAEVHLKPEDMVFEQQIRQAIQASGGDPATIINEDRTITWGGCLVYDAQGGRIFNGTIERNYYRQAQVIRREIMQMLEKSSNPPSPLEIKGGRGD